MIKKNNNIKGNIIKQIVNGLTNFNCIFFKYCPHRFCILIPEMT